MQLADALSSYPYVTVRLACSRCARRGQYALSGWRRSTGLTLRWTLSWGIWRAIVLTGDSDTRISLGVERSSWAWSGRRRETIRPPAPGVRLRVVR